MFFSCFWVVTVAVQKLLHSIVRMGYVLLKSRGLSTVGLEKIYKKHILFLPVSYPSLHVLVLYVGCNVHASLPYVFETFFLGFSFVGKMKSEIDSEDYLESPYFQFLIFVFLNCHSILAYCLNFYNLTFLAMKLDLKRFCQRLSCF